jgi:hypothetical protein
VTVTVVNINDPPVANNDNYSTPVNTPLNVPAPGVLANDIDIDSVGLTVDPGSIVGPSNGTLAINPDGSFSYIPNPGFTGSDSFTYQAFDGFANSGSATVAITVP